MTKEEFHQKLIEKYGNKFDDSKFDFQGTKIKGLLKCKLCGKEMMVKPNDLFSTVNYHVCGFDNKKTDSETYLQKANFVHNNFFTYPDLKLPDGLRSEITIRCPYHGDFNLIASYHLNGGGCPKCKDEGIEHEIAKLPQRNKSTRKLTDEEVRKRIGGRYGTEKMRYVNNATPIILTCPIHGDFEILPLHLFQGQGCRKCARNEPKTTESFIEEAKIARNDIDYNYEHVEYNGYHVPVLITCPRHGDFPMTPANFLHGRQSCPLCKPNKMQDSVRKALKDKDIAFIEQCRRSTLLWLDRLSLDFYLPDRKLAIECQGIQHFQPVARFGGDESFSRVIERDKLKKTLCEEHGITLLYYTNLSETEATYPCIHSLEELIEEILKNS